MCVVLLADGDRAAFPSTRRRQPHLYRGNGGGGHPDVSLEIFFDTAWEWLVAVVRRPVSPVPPPFTTPPPIVLSDAHRGLYPCFLRSSVGGLRFFPPSIMCFSFRMFARLPVCSPVLAPPSPPAPPLLTPLPSPTLFFKSPVALVTPACMPFFFAAAGGAAPSSAPPRTSTVSTRRAPWRWRPHRLSRSRRRPPTKLALAVTGRRPRPRRFPINVGGDRLSPPAPPRYPSTWTATRCRRSPSPSPSCPSSTVGVAGRSIEVKVYFSTTNLHSQYAAPNTPARARYSP